MITILKPIWNGGQRYLGLANYRVLQEPATVTVECTYSNKAGVRIYPKLLKIDKAMVLRQKTMTLTPSGTIIYLVPIENFECPMTKKELTSEVPPVFETAEEPEIKSCYNCLETNYRKIQGHLVCNICHPEPRC